MNVLEAIADGARIANEQRLEIVRLRDDLAAAIAAGADIVAQRDTALGLCGQRERELAAVTDGLHKSMDRVTTLAALLLTERLSHAETRKALELAAQQVADVAGRSAGDLESTRAELAKAEARVKELESALHQAWKERASLPANVCEEIRTVLRNG